MLLLMNRVDYLFTSLSDRPVKSGGRWVVVWVFLIVDEVAPIGVVKRWVDRFDDRSGMGPQEVKERWCARAFGAHGVTWATIVYCGFVKTTAEIRYAPPHLSC